MHLNLYAYKTEEIQLSVSEYYTYHGNVIFFSGKSKLKWLQESQKKRIAILELCENGLLLRVSNGNPV